MNKRIIFLAGLALAASVAHADPVADKLVGQFWFLHDQHAGRMEQCIAGLAIQQRATQLQDAQLYNTWKDPSELAFERDMKAAGMDPFAKNHTKAENAKISQILSNLPSCN